MKSIWDERYSKAEYIYGKEPNEFFKKEIIKLEPGKILLPAEGEGRNAVFAAKLGWDVYAFDSSIEAKKKAVKLAAENKVNINYQIQQFEEIDYPNEYFDFIGLFYAHNQNRSENHKKLIMNLKKRGIIVLEGFSKEQINFNSGGPQKIEMLFSIEELKFDFAQLSNLEIQEKIIFLNEGNQHLGSASVINLIGIR